MWPLADVFTWCNAQPWFGAIANYIQYSTVLTWTVLMWHIWHNRCHHCWRPGQVPVKGTHWKVCKKHAQRHGHTH